MKHNEYKRHNFIGVNINAENNLSWLRYNALLNLKGNLKMTLTTQPPKTLKRKRANVSEKLAVIRKTALTLLIEYGYEATTMINIAKHAKMSKETLYGLFNSKDALLADLIQHNATHLNTELQFLLQESTLPLDQQLIRFGIKFLTLITSDSAVAINRIAISTIKSDNVLAKLLYQHGRQANLPLLDTLLKKATLTEKLKHPLPPNASEIFIGLLLGDLQTRRLLGVEPAPNHTFITHRAKQATDYFIKIFS